MAAPLKRVLVCKPDTAGWGSSDSTWKDLGYFHAPRLDRAASQHATLVEALEHAGAEVLYLPGGEELTLDSVYAHDASFTTDHGVILMHMGKRNRRGEGLYHRMVCEAEEIPLLGTIEPPGLTEAGDMVWLDETTLLIGEGYRTNADGIGQMRRLLEPHGIEVLGAPLPHGPGPDACLHLMSLISILSERTAVVDLPWLSVSTVQLLENKDFDLIHIDSSERDGMGCNVLALGDKRLLAIEENTKTNARLRQAGFDVLTYPGSEISSNGSGGPTCLTRPILRG